MEQAMIPNTPGSRHLKCEICSFTFHRSDHLKRHLLIHKPPKQYRCQFCSSTYSRGDVLRRHWTTCAKRLQSGQEIPKADSGGKHRHACDACARLKKACNGLQPCAECESRGKLCSYERLTGQQPARDKRGESTSVYAGQQDWETKGFGYQTLLPPKPTYLNYRTSAGVLPGLSIGGP
ncbi:C2H2 type zinc finger domain protein [Aspergillus lentulus]|uniref:C2H2 type zinc finger domain protein n=1 Tax=Aspergillus lentulus TaxID=293939 RepID=A0ABQ0ZWX6_ASPLE|nr:C2H2 type zinc finger domain protein [Aspergillus lentulus]GFF28465.1 C2H2 type zinc finger domain protein [Aspergillus lentulus]GFF49214.1 C2H2 type zinc finger domain protein [Aspergillus lentulus]GFF67582.1 C2H2 type zinc finger domain protein [Aspergillus lentulus]GFG05550.1 C2H2 type zinc finger domain protein [Aspergillus lentulus]